MGKRFIEKLFYSSANTVWTPYPVAETLTVFSICSCSQRRETLLAVVRVSTNTVFASLPQYSSATAVVGARIGI